jgi:hypothetical protein
MIRNVLHSLLFVSPVVTEEQFEYCAFNTASVSSL